MVWFSGFAGWGAGGWGWGGHGEAPRPKVAGALRRPGASSVLVRG